MTATQPAPQQQVTIDAVIKRYIEVRNQKGDAAKRHKEEIAQFDAVLEKIEAYLMAKMNHDGTTSLKTSEGTAFKALQTSVSINDPEQFKSFVVSPIISQFETYLREQNIELEPEDLAQLKILLMEGGFWGVAEIKASKTGVKEYIEEKQQTVPGVTVNQVTVINVRKA